jgi:hypothetical protein
MIDPSLARRFLPDADMSTGPFGLLGLPVEQQRPDAIDRALGLCLATIGAHAQGASAEAQAVRDAVFVAAAQLRDPMVCRALVMRLSGQTTEPTAPAAGVDNERDAIEPLTQEEAGGDETIGRGVRIEDFRLATRRVLAASGGWNAQSKRQLGALAVGEQVDAGELRRVLVDINRSESGRDVRRGVARSAGARAGRPQRPANAGDAPQFDREHAREQLIAHSGRHWGADAVDAPPGSSHWRTAMSVATVVLLLVSGIMLITLGVVLFDRQGATHAVVQMNIATGAAADDENANPATEAQNASPRERVTANDVAGMQATTPSAPFHAADARELYAELRDLDEQAFAESPEAALERFSHIMRRLSSAWVEFDPGAVEDVVAPIAAVIEAAQDAGGQGLAQRAIDTLRALVVDATRANERDLPTSRDDVLSLLFGAAVLRELGGSLSGALAGQAAAAAADSLGGESILRSVRFKANALDASRAPGLWHSVEVAIRATTVRMADALAGGAEQGGGWSGLGAAAAALLAATPQRGAAVSLGALETLMRTAPNPSERRAIARAYDATLAALVWAGPDGAPAREALVDWLRDESIPASALSHVTQWLIDSGRLPALSAEHRLSTGADTAARLDVAIRLARTLGVPLSDGASERFLRDWSSEDRLLRDEGSDGSPAELALLVAATARLNQAAAMWWSGDEGGAESALELARDLRGRASSLAADTNTVDASDFDAPGRIDRTAPAGNIGVANADGMLDAADPDGAWAELFLNGRRDADQAITLLNRLEVRGGPIGRVDGAVLTEAATRMQPMTARRVAQRVVLRYADEPMVLSGMLDALPDAAAQDDVSTTVQAMTNRVLPDPRAADWRSEARAALVARLLDVLGGAMGGVFNAAESELTDAYSALAAIIAGRAMNDVPLAAPPAPGGTIADAAPGAASRAAAAAASFRDAWRDRAARYADTRGVFASLTELDRRHESRRSLAVGPVQRFVAEQAGAAEVMAWLVAVQRGSRAAVVSDSIDAWRRALGAASTSEHQLLETERLMAALWRLRLGREGGGA